MSQLLLPRYKRLMEPQSWRDFSLGIIFGGAAGALHGFALLSLLPAATSLANGNSCWGLSFTGWMYALAVIAAVAVAVDYYGTRTGYIGALGFLHDVHHAVGNKVSSLPLGKFDGGSAGRLSRMVTQEMINLGESAAHFIYGLIQKSAAALVIVFGTWFWDWRLGALLSGAIPVMVLLLNLSRWILNQGKVLSEPTEKELAARMIELSSCQGALRCCNVADDYPALDRAFTANNRVSKKALWIGGVANLINGALVQIIIVSLIVMVAALAVGGDLSALEAVVIIGMSLRFTTMLSDIGEQVVGLEERRQLMEHINAVMDEPSLSQPEKSKALNSPGTIELSEVNFGYVRETPVLQNVSFQVPAGSMCALVGPSGCGKTTVARLVARFWDTDSGEVKVGGVNVKDLSSSDLLSQISLVFQDVYLFDDTLEANIRLGKTDASDMQVRWAADLSGVTEITRRLPDGWDTRVGEGGRCLSGGERQRVSIARALIKQAPIVLFDEATSALDAENEANIVAAMQELRQRSTLLVIAHKLETIQSADQIVVLSKQGQVIQQGKHEELVTTDGQYRDFWQECFAAKGWSLV